MKFIYFVILFFITLSANSSPIEFIVSASAGGPADTITRKIVTILEDKSDLNFIVLNKPGAMHTLAYRHVMTSNKPSLIITTPEITKHPVIDIVEPVYNLGKFSIKYMVLKQSEIKDINDLVKISQKREIVFGNSGVGTYSNIGMMVLCERTIKCLPVPYKSAAEGILAILSKQIDTYAVVSYGSRALTEREDLSVIHTVKDDSFKITLYSNGIPKHTLNRISSILARELDTSFYLTMGIER